MWSNKGIIAAVICVFAFQFSGCGDESDTPDCRGVGPARCLGGFVPDEVALSSDGKVHTLAWQAGDTGPICVNGSNYRSFIRQGVDNAKTVSVYLPNDGAWLPKSSYILISKGAAPRSLSAAPQTNFTDAAHPILGDTDFLYVSACDGSLNVGDRDFTTEDLASGAYRDKDPRFYRGYINAVASINELARRNPNPEKVILIGSGAGAFGVILSSMHAAELFPNSAIYALQDGSPGFGMGDVDPSFVASIISGWGAEQSLPPNCVGCYDDGHLTSYVDYALETYPNLRFATYVSTDDKTIPLFINLSRKSTERELSPAHMECFVQKEMSRLREAHADTNRFNYFVVEGTHSTIATLPSSDPEKPKNGGEAYVATPFSGAEGISFGEWFEQFTNDDPDWASISEINMVPEVASCAELK